MVSYEKVVQDATPEAMLQEFPDLEKLEERTTSSGSESSISTKSSATQHDEMLFKGHDREQIRLMTEACICIDYNDIPYASGSKKTLHLMTSINKGLLHRAFSVFLFNTKGELLLQQRATEKITFPDLWTNTCCSHPLAVTSEMGYTAGTDPNGKKDLEAAIAGVKQAAVRKLEHELGITGIDVKQFDFLTRIHYMAPSSGDWGEHEVDYILFITADVSVNANENEVRDWKWVSKDQLQRMFTEPEYKFTPWFKLICESFLFSWWGQPPKRDDKLHRMLA